MTAWASARLGVSSGLSALETAATMLIVSLIAAPIIGIASGLVTHPVRWREAAEALKDAKDALHWIASDARQAQTFMPATSGPLGQFQWTDYASNLTTLVTYELADDRNEDGTFDLLRKAHINPAVGDPWRQTANLGNVEGAEISLDADNRRLVIARVKLPYSVHEGDDGNVLEIKVLMRPDHPSFP